MAPWCHDWEASLTALSSTSGQHWSLSELMEALVLGLVLIQAEVLAFALVCQYIAKETLHL
jgi:hypothetical protein